MVNRQAHENIRYADIERIQTRETERRTLERTLVRAGSREALSNCSKLNTGSTSSVEETLE